MKSDLKTSRPPTRAVETGTRAQARTNDEKQPLAPEQIESAAVEISALVRRAGANEARTTHAVRSVLERLLEQAGVPIEAQSVEEAAQQLGGSPVGRVSGSTVDFLVGQRDEKMVDLLRRIAKLDPVSLEIKRPLADKLFKKAFALFRKTLDSGEAMGIISRIASGETRFSTEDEACLRELKAAGDQVRTAFRLLGKEAQVPGAFHRFVRQIGRVKDAGINDKKNKSVLVERAQRCLALHEDLDLDAAAERFEPVGKDQISEQLAGNRDRVLQLLDNSKLKARKFHKVRKKLRDILDLLRLLERHADDDDVRAPRKAFRDLNRVLGDVHDDVITVSLTTKRDYDELKVQIPPELSLLVEALADRLDVGA